MPPPADAQQPDTLSPFGHGLYGYARSLYGVLGLPADLMNTLMQLDPTGRALQAIATKRANLSPEQAQATPSLPYTPPHIPLGTEEVKGGIDWLAEKTGLRTKPEPGSQSETFERWGGTYGDVMGPGKVAKMLRAPAINLPVLRNITSSGDAWIALQAIVGEEAVRELKRGASPEDMDRAGKLGAAGLPIVLQLLRIATTKGLKTVGNLVLPRHVDVPRTRQAATEAQQRLQEAQRISGEVRGDVSYENVVDANRAQDVLENRLVDQRTAQADLQTTKDTAAADLAAAKQRELLANQAAQTDVETARAANVPRADLTAQAMAPVDPALQRTGPATSTQTAGTAVKQDVLTQAGQAAEQKAAQQTAQARTDLGLVGPQLDDTRFINQVSGDLTPKFHAERKQAGTNFDVVEQHAVAKGAVEMPSTRATLLKMAQEQVDAGLGIPDQWRRWLELGLSPAQLEELGEKVGVERLQALATMVPAEKMDLTALRDIQNQMSAAGRGAPVGTLAQGSPRRIDAAVEEDILRFFESDVAKNANLGPDFEKARAGYVQFITDFNRGVMRHLVDTSAGYQRQNFIRFLSNTKRDQIPQLEAVLKYANPETQGAIRAHVAGELAGQASSGGVINPAKLKSGLERLEKNGTLEIFFPDPAQRQQLRDSVQTMTAADTSVLTSFRKALEKLDPEKTLDYVFTPGNLSRTQNYQTISDPAAWRQAREGWTRQFQQEMATYGADSPRVINKLRTMAQEQDGISQLKLLFPDAEFPGVVAQLQQSLDAAKAAGPEARRTAADLKRSQATAKTVAGREAAATTAVDVAGQATVTPVQARFDAAEAALQAAEDAKRQLGTGGKRTSAEVNRSTALTLRNAKKEFDAANAAKQAAERAAGMENASPATRFMQFILKQLTVGGASGALIYHGLQRPGPIGHALTGLGVAAGVGQVVSWGVPAFARTKVGEELLRNGISTKYGPHVAKWVFQTFAQEQGRAPETVPQGDASAWEEMPPPTEEP